MNKKINEITNKAEMVLLNKKAFSLPRSVQIEPTNLCNQKCKMCPRNTHLDVPLGSMSLENFKKILDQIPTVENLQLNGLGEPLMNESIFEMVKSAKEKGIFVTITSNCGIMTEEKAKKLIESGLDLLKISLDSLDPEIYRSIRNADPEASYSGIRVFMETKKELGAKNPTVWFNSILMKDTYNDMVKIIKFADELGVNMVRFKPINIFDLYKDKGLMVEKEELKKAVNSAMEGAKKFKVNHNLKKVLENVEKNIFNRPKEKIPCYAPWQEVYIQQYGGVRLCCEFYSSKFDIGNIFTNSFDEIWNGEKMKHIRKEFSKGNTFFPVCQNCNRFQKNITINNKIKKFIPWR